MDFVEYEYAPQADTCKRLWKFRVADGTIESLVIEGEKGCQGHPQTITALLKGQAVDTLDVDALSNTACTRDLSCGQALAEALSLLREEMK